MSSRTDDDRAAAFDRHRRYVFAVAYRLLGSVEDAEDVLQDAWLRFAGAGAAEIHHPRAYLVTVVTRLALDLLKSARRRREEYVGVWLPEPVPTADTGPDDLTALAESASFAFLLLLERLTPLQRAVLVLHDVFDHSHDQIAEMLGRTPAGCRQLLRRARVRLGPRPAAPRAPHPRARALAEAFLDATRSGEVERIVHVLAPDVVLLSDGGGRVAAVNRPLAGRTAVGRFFAAVSAAVAGGRDLSVRVLPLNARPGVLLIEDGRVSNAFVFDTTAAGITAIYVMRNPDKLRHLRPVVSG